MGKDCDIAIIGAGVIGLAIAAELADRNRDIYVVEKGATYGRGISSRNSEVVHAGIYYPPDTLKARLCAEGREMLYRASEADHVPCRRLGKLIIATTDPEMETVQQLWRMAVNNGVPGVRILDHGEVAEREPNIRAVGALLSPETGIISAHALMDSYARRAKAHGAEIVCGTEVVGIEQTAAGYRVATTNDAGESFAFTSERVINAAGLHADTIAGMVGCTYALHYCKGDYFSISGVKAGTVRGLVYPVPEKNHVGLGVHLTLDLGGRMKLGPDTSYIERKEDYTVDAAKRRAFFEGAVRFLPFLREEQITPDMSGIRPKLQGAGEGFRDFVIREDLPGFINLIGIESPGLTAAPAIGRYVKDLVQSGDGAASLR